MIPGKLDTISITTPSKGVVVKGRYIKGTSINGTIKGKILPLNGRELLNATEAQRNRGTKKLYTTSKLQTLDEKNSISPAIITYRDIKYEVQESFDFNVGDLLDHYKYFIVEINNQ